MSEKLPPLSPHKSKSWTEWLNSIGNVNLLKENAPEENQGNATQLPRSDSALYGIYPKMEPRVYVVCNDCSKMIRPYDVAPHTNQCKTDNTDKEKQSETPSSSSNAVKKKSSQTKRKRKSVLPANVPPPPLFPWFSTQCAKEGAASAPPSVQAAPSGSGSTSATVTTANPSSNSSGSSSSSSSSSSSCGGSSGSSSSSSSSSSSTKSHKKAKKQTIKGSSSKEQGPQKHSTLVVGDKGTHKHSSRSSHHSGSGKKVSSSESCKSATHHPHRHHYHYIVGSGTKHVKDGVKPVVSQFISIVPKPSASETVVETTPTASTSMTTETITQEATTSIAETVVTTVQSSIVQSIVSAIVASTKPSSTSDGPNITAMNTVPLVLMPMSPVAVVSPIQVIQLSDPVLHLSSPQQAPSPPLPTQPIVVSISDQNNGVKLYNTHPKPLILPTVANRKIGNTILLQNQRLEHQRNKIDVALNCKTFSLLNTMHKPNILKCRGMKMNLKRPATEKLPTNECKQTRQTPDVNGFILHADVSESAEAPQPDNSIHEKIALMNMK